MTERQRLPDRRQAETLNIEVAGNVYQLSIGYFADGRVGEVFLGGPKSGSDMQGLLADLGVVISRLFQHGDTPLSLAAGMARLGDGTTPASIVGVIADALAGETK